MTEVPCLRGRAIFSRFLPPQCNIRGELSRGSSSSRFKACRQPRGNFANFRDTLPCTACFSRPPFSIRCNFYFLRNYVCVPPLLFTLLPLDPPSFSLLTPFAKHPEARDGNSCGHLLAPRNRMQKLGDTVSGSERSLSISAVTRRYERESIYGNCSKRLGRRPFRRNSHHKPVDLVSPSYKEGLTTSRNIARRTKEGQRHGGDKSVRT